MQNVRVVFNMVRSLGIKINCEPGAIITIRLERYWLELSLTSLSYGMIGIIINELAFILMRAGSDFSLENDKKIKLHLRHIIWHSAIADFK